MTNWDPKPTQREWYRHVMTGERGFRIVRNGMDRVQVARQGENLDRPLDPREWTRETEQRPYSVAQIAQVAHAADAILCRHIGLYETARKKWADLTDEQKQRWYEGGPRHPKRQKLYRSIMDSFEGEVG